MASLIGPLITRSEGRKFESNDDDRKTEILRVKQAAKVAREYE